MEFLVAGIPRKGRGFTGMSIKVRAAVLSWDGATGQQRGWEGWAGAEPGSGTSWIFRRKRRKGMGGTQSLRHGKERRW